MPTTEILAASRASSVCRGCGAPIEFAEVAKTGRTMPFDAPIVVLQTKEDLLDQRQLETVDLAQNHFATCPQAASFRRR